MFELQVLIFYFERLQKPQKNYFTKSQRHVFAQIYFSFDRRKPHLNIFIRFVIINNFFNPFVLLTLTLFCGTCKIKLKTFFNWFIPENTFKKDTKLKQQILFKVYY